ncbi:hypothetical protein EAG_13527 [Camponotus floridanus]|uniref:Uncharacterized protein n=1 Tax=Camponotus floridanus TaxID=104421 RepID=E2ABL9_CAMFO|nr:hypothetical protein EAG_13527 [Camponotus floridanus]
MRVALVYLLVAMTCVMVQEANSTPGFFSGLLEHCPLPDRILHQDFSLFWNIARYSATFSQIVAAKLIQAAAQRQQQVLRLPLPLLQLPPGQITTAHAAWTWGGTTTTTTPRSNTTG